MLLVGFEGRNCPCSHFHRQMPKLTYTENCLTKNNLSSLGLKVAKEGRKKLQYKKTNKRCQWVGMPGLGSRLTTYWPKKGQRNSGLVCTPLPIKPLSIASLSRHLDSSQKGWCEERTLWRSQTVKVWLELQSQ